MPSTLVPIPTNLISDLDSFHTVLAEGLGLPDCYGANMDSCIDCMTYADDPEAQMLSRGARPGEILTLQIDEASDFAARCPEQFKALMECTAFVNYRRAELGGKPMLSLLMSGYFA